jgi:hypothetical protein
MGASVRVVVLGSLVAVALALCFLAVAPQASAANEGRRDKLLRPLCTAGQKGNYKETFYVRNPRRHGVSAQLVTSEAFRVFQMPPRSDRYVTVRIRLLRGPDATLYFNRNFVDADNVRVERCIVVD